MKWLVLLASAAVPLTAQSVFYSKHFPGSLPAYVSVEISKNGSAVYKEAPDDDNPVEFRIPDAETQEVFALAEKLDRFKRPLESGLKVARMGDKTFRFVNGDEKNEVKFNFSLDENARVLLDLFERMTETQQLLFILERSVKFDKLGVNKALLQVESAWDRKRIVGPDRFLPLLDRISKNGSYLNMARERSGALAAAFRNPPEKVAATEQK
jgi:hypothetical protein